MSVHTLFKMVETEIQEILVLIKHVVDIRHFNIKITEVLCLMELRSK